MGKGDNRRPTLVSEEEFKRRWEDIFGKKEKRDEQEDDDGQEP